MQNFNFNYFSTYFPSLMRSGLKVDNKKENGDPLKEQIKNILKTNEVQKYIL